MTTALPAHRPIAIVLTVVLGLAALGSTGCASTPSAMEEEARVAQAKSHFEIGVDHLSRGRTALALRELLAAESLAPERAQIQYALGEAYLLKSLHEQAETHLLRAIELQPDYHDARLHLVVLYLQQERYAEAVQQSEVLIDDATFPGPWRALSNAGWAEYKLGDKTAARSHLELALEYSPHYWPAMLNLAILEAQEGHRPEAIALLGEILELHPGGSAAAEANYRLAEIYVSLGKRDRAVSHLLAAVEGSPNGRWGQKSEEYLKLLR